MAKLYQRKSYIYPKHESAHFTSCCTSMGIFAGCLLTATKPNTKRIMQYISTQLRKLIDLNWVIDGLSIR